MDITLSPEVIILLPLIAFAAFFVKAISGFGPAIVVVALGSLIIPPQAVIPVSSLLDATAGAILFAMDPVRGKSRFWVPLGLAITAGSVVGGYFLTLISPDVFRLLLAVAIILLGAWFFAGRIRKGSQPLETEVPDHFTSGDMLACGSGGLMGGFLGISGPPLLWHFGRRFAKAPLRQILIPVFLVAALARASTYAVTGALVGSTLLAFAISLPGLLLGIWAGNRLFVTISERTFSRVIGAVIAAVGVRLLF